MPDAKTGAEPSAAATPKFDPGDQYTWSPEQREHWNLTGEAPEPPASEDSAASASSAKETQSEGKPKSAPESEAGKRQEKPKGEKKTAEERIAELIAENKRLKEKDAERERSRSEKDKAPEPAKAAETAKPENAPPATYAEWRKGFKPKEWVEKWLRDNPENSYEDAVSALADYQSDVRIQYQQWEQLQAENARTVKQMIDQTKSRYPDAEEKLKTVYQTLAQAETPNVVKFFINESEVMTDLCYTLSDPATLANLIETAKTYPGRALRVLRDMERDIQTALKSKSEAKSDAESKPAPKAEEKPAPVTEKRVAPKPAAEVGGRGAVSEDPAMAAVRANDFAGASAEWTRRALARSR